MIWGWNSYLIKMLLICKIVDNLPNIITCSKLAIETLEKGVKYVQN